MISRLGWRLAAVFLLTVLVEFAAFAAAPLILNANSPLNWLESPTVKDNGAFVTVTFVVRHDAGDRVTAVVTPSGTLAVTPQTFSTLPTFSRVTLTFAVARPGSFSCPFIGASARRVDQSMSFRVITSTGQSSQTVGALVRFIENDNCTSADDFPVLESTSQSAVSVSTGQPVAFTFTADDADSTGANDRADRIYWRTRNLATGVLSGETEHDAEDNTARTFSTTFAARGRYVVEARICGEDSCQDGGWWRIGAVDVNDGSGPSVVLSAPGSINLSVNAGATLNVVASASDAGSGAVHGFEWDATGDGSFERREIVSDWRGSLLGSQLTQSVDTATPGLKTILGRATDNGAISIADNIRRTTTASLQIRVNAIPTAGNLSVATPEETAKVIALAGSDADNQPATLRYEIVTLPQHGSLSCIGASCTYTPAAAYSGPDSFTYRVADGPASTAWSFSNTATVTISVSGVNDSPVAADLAITTDEETARTFTPSVTDADSTALTLTASAPAHGSASCVGRDCTYTPDANYHGSDSFTYRVTDEGGLFDEGVITVTVSPVNDAPVAADASVTTDEDADVTFTLPVSDVDGDTPAITVTGLPAHGAVSCDVTCTYTPNANYHGLDSFTYRATDAASAFDEATVDVTVAPVNDPPVAGSLEITTDEDTSFEFAISATDVDSDALTFTPSAADHGDVTCSGSTCTYTPHADYFGADSVAVIVSDGEGSATASIAVTVAPVNDPPAAEDMLIETAEDAAVTFTPPASDVDDATLTITAGTGAHGTVSCAGSTCTYTPNANFFGGDSVAYTATDANGASDSGTINVVVHPVNDEPVAADANGGTAEDTPLLVTINAVDVDDTDLTYTPTVPEHGAASCDGAICTYTPHANYFGGDAFNVVVSDGERSDTATVTVVIHAVNDAPVIDDASIETAEDAPVTFTPPASDVDSASLSLIASDPAHGSVSCAATCTYSPDPNFFGSDSFTLTASDGELTDSATVFVTVVPVNDRPTIQCSGNLERNTDAGVCGASISAPVMGSDVEDGPLTATCTRGDGAPIGSAFPLGTTAIQCAVVDLAGDSASCSFNVTVIDAEGPAIIAPNAVFASTDAHSCFATVSDSALGNATASDACSTTTVVRSGVPAANEFPIGVTLISYTARDSAGNESAAQQSVEVRDATLPLVTASLTGVGTVHRTWGNFRAGFTADDSCGLGAVVAVMSVPSSVRDFAVRFANGGPNTVIRIDLDRREISLAGQNDAEKSALLAQIMNDGGLRVAQGQEMRIDADGQGRALEFRFENGVLTRMQAPVPELRVTATDVYGNVAVATATARFE